MEAPAEIKVKTRKFSLTKGTIKISFELEGSRGRIRSLKLKQRNAVLDTSFPFEMQTAKKGNTIVYHAQINVDQYPMETAFWMWWHLWIKKEKEIMRMRSWEA